MGGKTSDRFLGSVVVRMTRAQIFSKRVASEGTLHDNVDRAVLIQRRYYAETAALNDGMHAHEGVGDHQNLGIVRALLHLIEPRTLLDVGAGTGRGLRYFRETVSSLLVRGIEPVGALIEQAATGNEIPLGSSFKGCERPCRSRKLVSMLVRIPVATADQRVLKTTPREFGKRDS